MRGTTSTGFSFEIDKNIIADDWELLELLVAADAGDHSAAISAMKQILGDSAYKALKEHVRKENGRVSSVRMKEEFMEILNQLGDATKNS